MKCYFTITGPVPMIAAGVLPVFADHIPSFAKEIGIAFIFLGVIFLIYIWRIKEK
jgi:hypothetical protein